MPALTSPARPDGPFTRYRDIGAILAAILLVGLTLPPAPASAQFRLAGFDGSAAAVNDGRVYLGGDGGPITAGAVHIFENDGSGWNEVARVTPENEEPGMGFGSWLAVSGNSMVVGAQRSIHVFERSGEDWLEVYSELLDEPVYGGDISGDLIALRANSNFIVDSGPMRVLRRGDSGWMPAGSIEAPEDVGTESFGASVRIMGETIAVGAPFAGGVTGEDYAPGPGAVYFYASSADGWTLTGVPLRPSSDRASAFGVSLEAVSTADGEHLFVTTGGSNRDVPSVDEYVLDEEAGEWTHVYRYASPMMSMRGRSRASPVVAMAGAELWIGGIYAGSMREGQVLRFRADGDDGARALMGTLTANTFERGGGFGAAITAEGGVAVVDAPGRYNRAGVFHVFERTGDDWTETGELWIEAPNYTAINGATACEEGQVDAFGCSEIEILSFVPIREMGGDRGIRANDVWGWTDPENEREYALVGLSNATSFVDITDAEAPRYLGRLLMPEGANSSAWRDIKVYENHAFIVSDGAGRHGMQVFDLTRLRDVGAEPADFAPDFHYTEIASAHNIVINESSGFAYSVGSSGGGETCGGGLHMIDIREPKTPTFAGCFGHEGTGRRGTGYSHDAMCITYAGPDEAHAGKEICFGANETAISIADVTDKANPTPIAQASYPNVAYAHQGWITDDHRYFYLGDEGDEGSQTRAGTPFPGTRTLVWDVTDLDDPVFVGEHFGETASTDHNMYVVGDLLYQSNYTSGLRVLDISDRENPREVGYIDTVPYDDGVAMTGSWSNYPYFRSGTVIVTSGREGLFMVRYRKPIT